MEIKIELEPTKADAEQLSQGIIAFNKDAVRDLEPVEAENRFHVMARDESGALQGGLRATRFWNTLHIELLWLSVETRGGGTGSRLLKQAEQFARANDCENALVETTSWQAKPFYERHGYRHLATLDGRPKGHSSHYLSKKLT